MSNLAGRVAIIIGGTRGIGAAISRKLIADGARVGMIYLSRVEEAERLVSELNADGGSASAAQADVGDPVQLLRAIDLLAQDHGGIDILVSVAGLAITGPLQDYSDHAFDRVFAVNVRAPFIAAKRAAEVMPSGGRIIMIGSIVADRMPGVGGTLYAASKAALGGLTRGLARDLGERGITANLVQPGPIDTERNPADGPNAELNRSPLAVKRHGTPGEVASLVSYLASSEAGFVTGATYNIDGGWSA
jgi:3-oxoacyl-[acyl-carrier protein] reductase